MKRKVLFLAIIVCLTAVVRVPLLSIPFERDEGEYAYIAWRLGHNELPYRDWVDQKPPAVFWVYRLALSLPLDPVRSVHLAGMLFSAASAAALFLLARRFMSDYGAATAAVLFVFLSADPRVQGTAANTEVFMLLPLILSQLAFLSATSAARGAIVYMVLSGALTGIAVAFKQVAAVNWLFLAGAFPIFVARGNPVRNTVAFAAWSAAGVAAVWGFVILYFFLREGLGDFIYNVFTHNLEYIQATSWGVRWRLCAHTLAVLARTQAFVWCLAAAGLVALGLARRHRWLLFLAGWLVTSLAGVGASGHFFPHYFQQMLPVVSVAAAIGAEAIYHRGFWSRVPAACRKAVLGGAAFLLPAIALYPFLFTYTPAEAVRKIYPGNFFAEMPELGRRIAELTRPNDRVFVFGAEPEVLFYARRVSATRYIFLFPLYGPYADAHEKQVSTAREITLARPAVALVHPNTLFYGQGTDQSFSQWSESYLRENFRLESYLTADSSGVGHVIPAGDVQGLSVLEGQEVYGQVLVRTAP